jgi:hypothetical protein
MRKILRNVATGVVVVLGLVIAGLLLVIVLAGLAVGAIRRRP